MRSVAKVVFAAVSSLAVPAVFAHHSGAGFSKDTKEITGTVKEFQFTNPHSWIQVNVADDSGKIVEWSVEWGSPNQLGRDGYRPSTFAPGTKVSIKLHPMANGALVGGFIAAKMPDGKIIGKWDGE
jgi:hypothetical protein